MSDNRARYNGVVPVDGELYLWQDGELFDEPMVREFDDLLEVERDPVQKMVGELDGR